MNETPLSIFRPEALRCYSAGREKSVLPRFVSPRTFACLWILSGLLLAGGLFIWMLTIQLLAYE